jgi:hypothetical protein
VARTTRVSQVLWLLTTTWLTGCGRLGFDVDNSGLGNGLPDAPVILDAAIGAPVGPAVTVAAMPSIITACGSAPKAFLITLQNPGDQDLIIDGADVTTVSPTQGNLFSVPAAQFPVRIAPGAMGTLAVAPPRAVVGSDRATKIKSGTLTLRSNAAAVPAPIALDARITGANLDILPAGTSSLVFTDTSGNCPMKQTVTVTNSGTDPINVGQLAAVGITSAGFSGGALAPGQAMMTDFRPFTSAQCAASGVLRYDAVSSGGSSTNLCTTPVVISVTLSITGSSTSSCSCS